MRSHFLKTAVFFLISLSLISGQAIADGLHITGGIYGYSTERGEGTETRLLNDIRLGWGFDFSDDRLAVLVMSERDVRNETGLSKETRNSVGLSLAYYLDRFYAIGTWVFQTEIEGRGRRGTSSGQGYRIDLGTNFQITETLGVGPRFIFRSYQYDDDSIGENNFESFEPTFSFAFKF